MERFSIITAGGVCVADSKHARSRQMVGDVYFFVYSGVWLGHEKEELIVCTRLGVLSEAELPKWW